ncbi:hypothetical protein P3H15_27470 [Rhodococcus sp. T2V]|uniref:hypothetical protein n=1 Tax=Rhodococcus sp. T2V TaxID=3034164 RepID=UPI0023E112F6|nr:hypothetical protein [Rhodococcus sp. T2V]MDF3308763.1 hypothetical protein [Rhodococcus sp. T2V]
MILYSCESCDFGIAGSNPETAEDEYELRQDIDAHEEMHRAADEAADDTAPVVDVPMRDEATPLTHDDIHTDEVLASLEEQGKVIRPLSRNPLGASAATQPGWSEGLEEKVAETERRRAEWEASLLTRDDARSLVRAELVDLLRLAKLSDLGFEGDHALGDLLESLLKARDGGDFRSGSAVLLEVAGDGEAVGDVASHETSPSVDGRSSPTVGDGQVAEGVEASSAANAGNESRAYRLLSGATPEGAAELDALPYSCLIEATGSYLKGDGGFSRCWARPVPSYVAGADRLWQVLVHGDSDYMSGLVPSSRIGLARVLYVGEEAARG